MLRSTFLALLVTLAACARLPQPKPAPYQASDAAISVTRIVHASVIVALRRTQVIVDPWFHSGTAVYQTEPLGLLPDALPPLNAVLLTNDRADHFDETALRGLATSVPVVVVPAGLEARVAGFGFAKVVPLAPWGETAVDDVTITAVPSIPTGSGTGYLLVRDGSRVYVAGETQAGPELDPLIDRLKPLDVALLPIGGRSVAGIGGGLGPEVAARFAARLGAQRTIPYHYGAGGGAPLIWYAGKATERFVTAANRAGLKGPRVVVLKPGDGWHYSR